MSDGSKETLLQLIDACLPWSGWSRTTEGKHVLEFVEHIDIGTRWVLAFVSGAGVEGRDVPRMLDALMHSIENSPYVLDVRCIGNANPPGQVMRVYPVLVLDQEKECFDAKGFRTFLDYQIATFTLSGRYHSSEFSAYMAGYRATCALADVPPRAPAWRGPDPRGVEV